MSEIAKKTCAECHTVFKGRMDKKFCSDQCRSTYNNRHNRNRTNYIRNVNNALLRNRRILIELNPDGGTNKVSHDKLVAKGFDFEYFTSTYINRDGGRYFYCYDQGYLPIDDDCYLLVKKF